jgi:glycosyltransferase involved in cell wall biosynthesis
MGTEYVRSARLRWRKQSAIQSTESCSVFEHASARAILVFADDWGRHPSSCQHLVSRLLHRHKFFWVNTIGMRPPRLDWATVRRGLGKLRQWLGPKDHDQAQETSPNLQTLNPRMWPWFTRPIDRQLNKKLLLRQLMPVAKALPIPPLAITTVPIVADLMNALPVFRWVYYCVDDFSKWPGLDQAALGRMEQQVVRNADVLIAASQTLQERLARMGRESFLLTHGVDLDFWAAAPRKTVIPALETLERPLITFWGVVDRRLDVTFLQHLAQRLARGTIVLAGPEADPDPALQRIPRLIRTGQLDFAQLPCLADASDVLIMPYGDLPVTRAMQPLKFKEYLATGKPAVVRDLPATRPWSDSADLVASPEDFANMVVLRLKTGTPETQAVARKRLTGESWDEKASLFERWIFLEQLHGNGTCCA